ncbi:MAG: hydrogenase, partial [bacterium]|nr:hydrogenase [bacterium]
MEWLITGIILTSFVILGSSQLVSSIRMVALQGALLSILPTMARSSFADPHSLLLFIGAFAIKAVVIPVFLFRSLKQAKIRKEVEPIVSLHLSLIGGGAILVMAFSSFRAFGLPTAPFPPLIIPAAMATVLIGFFLLISRTKAITQVIGFLILENGVFLFCM